MHAVAEADLIATFGRLERAPAVVHALRLEVARIPQIVWLSLNWRAWCSRRARLQCRA